ncbi:ROK family transcriptional regulator [Sporosarcina sp. Marseille-Q4063]|uniref:ROK family transcriptional regulator n=1 Tax=Sporosarcina sp. Marseille-Q4063 TaxID=2810514 RepID=UPI001BB035F7|nr:ROK family transcriptional regulator [Sporosarcina sp. Marseille-Q4063]QUW21541.1 ROK family transcriptional regulator [Sporosarcina sp. Marseille-Q4063]
MRQGTFQWMKSVNKSIILNKIRTDAPISRAQIAKETKLTPPTVSSNVKELIEQGIVKESELGKSQGGRKPTMLLIDNSAFSIVGVDIGPDMIECVMADLSGKISNRSSNKLTTSITNKQFLTILKECIRTCIGGSPTSNDKIIGIGVAMHGVVEVETGTSLVAPILGLKNIPIKEELEKEFDLDVKVENDARAIALGESWFGDHGPLESMLVVNIGRGVGAGLVMNGNLYHGSHDIAGEVGHMTIDLNGEVCECGNPGCLQTFITGPAIARRAQKFITKNQHDLSGEQIYELAVIGDENIASVFKETGEIIGVGLTNLIHIINPEKIVLSGGVTKSGKLILPEIRKSIENRALTPKAKQTAISVSKLGDDATLKGAVALLLVDLFDPL